MIERIIERIINILCSNSSYNYALLNFKLEHFRVETPVICFFISSELDISNFISGTTPFRLLDGAICSF